MSSLKIYRAKWILPIHGSPIENGEIVIEGERILETRTATSETSNVRDFGEAVLMPGLVNVHTHLDYTVMRGLLEDLPFFTWIRELTLLKTRLEGEDWLASATWGAAEAVAGGVTTIGDCCDSGAAFYGAKALGLSGTIYQEVFGIDGSQSIETILGELKGKVEALRLASAGTRLGIGISPHAPYTVRPALFRALASYADAENLRVCIHAAESPAEGELFYAGTGVIAEMFQRRGIEWEAPVKSVVAYLDSLGILSSRTLLVHGVQVSASDRFLTRERDLSWAHCPKSNAKLGAGVAPLGILQGRQHPIVETEDAYIPKVGLGSDSVASNNCMDLFEEMRFGVLMQRANWRKSDSPGAKEFLEMATLGGARALGLEAEIGTLEPGKLANVCVVRLNELHSAPSFDPYSSLVYASRASDVIFTLIGGEVKFDATLSDNPLERFPGLDLTPTKAALLRAANKLRGIWE